MNFLRRAANAAKNVGYRVRSGIARVSNAVRGRTFGGFLPASMRGGRGGGGSGRSNG